MEASVADQSWSKIGKIDPHCFACGFENEHGLDMNFEIKGDKLRCKIEVPAHLRGWSNLVHGGIISTMIDEAMSWAAIHLLKKFILTKNMSVEFKKPIKINSPLVVYGFVVEQQSDRSVTMAAEIYNEEGDLCARGKGDFALFSMEKFAELGVIEREQLEAMAAANK